MAKKPKPFGKWKTEWLAVQEGGVRRVPAMQFLLEIDEAPKLRLLQIFESVKATGGPQHWKDVQSHAKMEDELDDVHEARDRHDQTLYRLYLKWVTATATVWVLDGRMKPNGTKLADVEYEKIVGLAALVDTDPPPTATVDDMAQTIVTYAPPGP